MDINKLTIYGGIFTANQGNGIGVRGGNAIVYDGYCYGNDLYIAYKPPGSTEEDGPIAGPGASYAFKVYGGIATVNGGMFGWKVSDDGTPLNSYSSGSGAFVMGTAGSAGTAEIFGGTFEVDGQAGFSIYQYADVTFGAENSDTGPNVTGGITAVALEKEHSTNTDRKSVV